MLEHTMHVGDQTVTCYSPDQGGIQTATASSLSHVQD